MAVIAEQTDSSPQQQLFAQVSVYLHDYLRTIFDACEKALLGCGETFRTVAGVSTFGYGFVRGSKFKMWTGGETRDLQSFLDAEGSGDLHSWSNSHQICESSHQNIQCVAIKEPSGLGLQCVGYKEWHLPELGPPIHDTDPIAIRICFVELPDSFDVPSTGARCR